jgi:hypothetical protein
MWKPLAEQMEISWELAESTHWFLSPQTAEINSAFLPHANPTKGWSQGKIDRFAMTYDRYVDFYEVIITLQIFYDANSVLRLRPNIWGVVSTITKSPWRLTEATLTATASGTEAALDKETLSDLM